MHIHCAIFNEKLLSQAFILYVHNDQKKKKISVDWRLHWKKWLEIFETNHSGA